MAAPEELCTIANADEFVRDKVTVLWRRTAAIAGDDWLKRRAPCVDWTAPDPSWNPYAKHISPRNFVRDKEWLTPPSRFGNL